MSNSLFLLVNLVLRFVLLVLSLVALDKEANKAPKGVFLHLIEGNRIEPDTAIMFVRSASSAFLKI